MKAAARQVTVGAALSLAALSLVAAPRASGASPEEGRHAAELCVATAADSAPKCGPAQAEVRRDGSVRIRVDDIVYRLQLRSSQADVVLMHGAMQIDEFTVPYEWTGRALRFSDERDARYEIRFPPRAAVRR